jgi:hypothetical protein
MGDGRGRRWGWERWSGGRGTCASIVVYGDTAGGDVGIIGRVGDVAEDYVTGKAITGLEFSHNDSSVGYRLELLVI